MSDFLLGIGIALVVLGVIALLAPLASGVLFDALFGALLIGAGLVEFAEAGTPEMKGRSGCATLPSSSGSYPRNAR